MTDDLACSRCDHLNADHSYLSSSDIRDGGAIVCSANDNCTCIRTWTPEQEGAASLPPDFAVVVLQVRQWAEQKAWSEDRLIDTLANFERMRK